MPTQTETEFSIYKPFTAMTYTDRVFRERPDGIRLSATYTWGPVFGEQVVRTGSYTKEDGQYVLKHGFDVIGLFWCGDESKLSEQNGAYYPDEVAFALINPIDDGEDVAWMEVKFTSAPQAKKGGAPF